jgi:hypothetical protein
MPTGFKHVLMFWLNHGIFNEQKLYDYKHSVLQSGAIFNLIVNYTFDGIETATFANGIQQVLMNDFEKSETMLNFCFGFIRYGNDFTIVLNYSINVELVKNNVENFLNLRGITVNKEKFKETFFFRATVQKKYQSSKFNFLGFTFMYRFSTQISRIASRSSLKSLEKIIIYPSRKNVIVLKKKLRSFINKASNVTAIQLLQKLNLVLRKWTAHFAISACANILNEIDNYVHKCL